MRLGSLSIVYLSWLRQVLVLFLWLVIHEVQGGEEYLLVVALLHLFLQ